MGRDRAAHRAYGRRYVGIADGLGGRASGYAPVGREQFIRCDRHAAVSVLPPLTRRCGGGHKIITWTGAGCSGPVKRLQGSVRHSAGGWDEGCGEAN